MHKDINIHFKSKNYTLQWWFKLLKIIILVLPYIGGLLLIVFGLDVLKVQANFIIICSLSFVGFMYSITKPIANDIEAKYTEKAFLKAKLHSKQVSPEKANRTVDYLVRQGFVVDKISAMGTNVLITYYVPMDDDDMEARIIK